MTPRAERTVRPLTPADADAYWHLCLEALAREPRAFGLSAEEYRATTVDAAGAHLADPDVCVLGLLVGAGGEDRLRGMAALVRDGRRKKRHTARVSGVYVGPELRGRGAGRQLLAALVGHARTLPGVERLTLAVATTQPAARAFYRWLGFVAWGRERAALKLGDEYVDEDHLALVL